MKKYFVLLLLISNILISMDSVTRSVSFKPINYKKMLMDIFDISEEDAQNRTLFTPKKNSHSNMELNIAVQAMRVDIVEKILQSQETWLPETLLEALQLLSNPYLMCLGLIKNDLANSKQIEKLLIEADSKRPTT